ncbi:MAG: DUF4127 family protein [Acidobacteriota bacterium]|nr:DUF4127 family protein [Acidobacteriota bacterium]
MVSRNDLAGKVLLIPRDDRFLELRTLAQIADHYLLLPPSHLLNPKPQPDKLIEWLKAQNLTGVSGVILSLEAISADASPETTARISQAIKQLRSQNPRAAFYGFTSLDSSVETSKQFCQSALGLTADGKLDLLLIGQDENLTAKPAQIARARLIGEAATREADSRIVFDDNTNSAAATLLARFLAQRLGRSPKLLPVYSSTEGRRSEQSRDSIPLDQSLAAKIKLFAGTVLAPTPETAPQVDVLLFVHTPNTSEEQRTALAMTVLQTIDSGARVAFVDVSESAKTKEAMLAELRGHKLLGKLTAYASAFPGEAANRAALNRVMAHAVIFFAAIKSLRNDIDRVHRIERNQINLLFSRILEDWAYEMIVRQQLEEYVLQQLKSDPSELGDKTELAEKFVYDALQTHATDLFDEQFRRNTHAVLMNSGTRVQFRVSLLQRLQVRFSTRKTSEPEFRQNIHTFFDGYLPGSRQ